MLTDITSTNIYCNDYGLEPFCAPLTLHPIFTF
jgi:hypothetical protein